MNDLDHTCAQVISLVGGPVKQCPIHRERAVDESALSEFRLPAKARRSQREKVVKRKFLAILARGKRYLAEWVFLRNGAKIEDFKCMTPSRMGHGR
jgi:hypothetical protein